ncbi:2-ketoarginine methyltransferase [Streptomyces sp. NPDC059534]|uniref:2-ketoarginine methyltransferase n=1 Tax=Streptomyces sp. NPDC059534 TaxID=3346859 RepID=UPI0036A86EEE
MIENDFENRLIDALQPVRYFALAHGIHQLMQTGLFRELDAEPGLDTRALAGRLGLYPRRLAGLCRYLANEGLLVESDGGWRLTDKARSYAPFEAWYTLLIGGYSTTFTQLGDVLKSGAPFATRDGASVGAGSCGMSLYDALPLVDQLLERFTDEQLTVVDLGCGDASFLIQLLERHPTWKGVGVEPDAGGAKLAQAQVDRLGLGHRVRIHHAKAEDATGLELSGRVCFLTAFVLQEMLEQEGADAVETLLKDVFAKYPDAHWAVIEVDQRHDDPSVMAHGLGLAYYNPYFLLHTITEQRLEPKQFWEAMFRRAGLATLASGHPDQRVDSTALELGYLLGTQGEQE